MRRVKLFWRRKKANLDRFVDLPTPLTPTMEMTYGRGFGARGENVEGEVMEVIERRMSREVVGVRIFRKEDSIAWRIVASTPNPEMWSVEWY